jgi:hypothetical protein
MTKHKFSVEINAPKEKVWNALWDDANYRYWTSVFSEGSHAETDWQEGSKIHFLDGKGGGMYSTVARNIPNEFMSIKHLGVVKDGQEQPQDEESKSWSGAMEDYKLESNGNQTHLTVEMDGTEEMKDYFDKTFPKALEKVKELAEK